DWMKPPKGVLGRGFAKRAEQSFILTNGSKVYASTVAPTAPDKTLRGKAVTFLVIDEAAFIKFLDAAWTALVPALATSQKNARKLGIPYGTVILSTPNKTVGVGKFFFERYSRALSGNDIFKPHTIYWRDIPELANDPKWHKNQCDLFDNDQKKIAQELELKFLPSEGSFFSDETVEKIQDSCQDPIEKFKLFNGEVWVFSKPVPGRYYMVGVDTATEYGSDKSAITVWDYQTLEQVWEYQGKCRVTDFVKIVKVAFAQHPGVFVIESNSCGNQVAENLSDSEFSYMLYKGKRGSLKTEGIYTSAKNRPLMIDALYSYVTEYPESIRSKRLALELTGLVEKTSGKVEADEGVNDDLAMSAGVAFFVRKYDPPTLIDTTNVAAGDLTNIIDFNTERVNMINPNIMSLVKDGIESGKIGGFVDILSMYNKT
ncbi:MAG: hypothetical protein U9O83_06785, partial [Campylobacterota bacterium]|nr:hypothetical protein [Campylobacterota bacterium]